MSHSFNYLQEFISEQPLYSTHQHHLERETHQKLDLDLVFKNSYVGWCSLPSGPSKEEREDWLQSIRLNSYFVWLEKSIASIYGVNRITAENWDELSSLITKAHQNPDYHLHLLTEKAKYIGFMEDSYWNPGSDIGYPDLITPVYRIDMWLQGFHPDLLDHDGCNPHTFCGKMPSFEAYVERFREEITKRRPNIAALKCASAYARTIRFEKVDRAEAASIYKKHPSELSLKEINTFGDYMFYVALDLAEQLDLPIQIHTGLAQLKGSSPLNLDNAIASYPNVQFVLFHGGFPWIYETAGLAHNYHNVILDINWLPLISTTAASQALDMYIEVLRDNKRIAWGSDTWTSEEAVGASMAFRHMLSNVLSKKVDQGYMDIKDAESFAEKIMFRNAKKIYNL